MFLEVLTSSQCTQEPELQSCSPDGALMMDQVHPGGREVLGEKFLFFPVTRREWH